MAYVSCFGNARRFGRPFAGGLLLSTGQDMLQRGPGETNDHAIAMSAAAAHHLFPCVFSSSQPQENEDGTGHYSSPGHQRRGASG